MPEMPDYDVKYPKVKSIDYNAALSQANQQLDPQYNMSRNNLLTGYQEQKKLLPQQLNARGQLYGGLRSGGETELTQQQAMALENLALQNNASKAELASSIQNNDYTKASQIAAQQYAAQQAQAAFAMQQWQAQMNNYQQNIENEATYSGLYNGNQTLDAQKLAYLIASGYDDSRGDLVYNETNDTDYQNAMNFWKLFGGGS
jgi:hypothetical protein